MTKKIKITSLEKTPEYIDREWAQVLAQRQYLLSTTDWTQLEDNELTFESRIRWNHWRNRVRAIRRKTCESKEEAQRLLKELEGQLPEREFIVSRTARQKKYHLDLNSLEQAKTDAINILKTLHNEWAVSLIPESIHLVHAKTEEMQRYYNSKPKPKSLEEYPFIKKMQDQNGLSRSQVLENIMTLKRTATDVLLMIEDHKVKFEKQIAEASTIDGVVSIVKNMHGY